MSDEGGEPITEAEKSLALQSLNVTAGMTVAGGAELARPGIIDKSGWGDGPWQDEPDLLQWCARTPPHYECQIARSVVTGSLCGYVAIPAGHPAHGMGWGRLDVDVHGDITFAEQGVNGVWVLGFDCGHGFDVSPALEARIAKVVERPHWHDEMEAGLPECFRTTYKPLVYVRAQVESLAAQLAAMAAAGVAKVRGGIEPDDDDAVEAIVYALSAPEADRG